MNGDSGLVQSYVSKLSGFSDFIVCPPFPLIKDLSGTFAVGAQNASSQIKGAFTGEVSPRLLKDIGCTYVLLGHSERRTLFEETPPMVALKTKCALDCDLIPIVCLRDENDLEGLSSFFNNVILAWEPAWAIGSGKTPTPAEVRKTISSLRERTRCQKILYGGSVNETNIDGFKAFTDGFLIGGMSLDVERMKAIL